MRPQFLLLLLLLLLLRPLQNVEVGVADAFSSSPAVAPARRTTTTTIPLPRSLPNRIGDAASIGSSPRRHSSHGRRETGRSQRKRSTVVSLPTTAASTAEQTDDPSVTAKDEELGVVEAPTTDDAYIGIEYYDPNEIHPRTKSLTESAKFFVAFCLKLMRDSNRRKALFRIRRRGAINRREGTAADGKGSGPAWLSNVRRLNEQRKDLVKLADYTASIVAPSFTVLTLGALMMSVIPHFYSQCIQVVATLDPSPARVFGALFGLAASSFLGALFTGMRGSLFWIGGTRANYNIRVKLHRNLLLQEAAFFDSTETGYLLSRLNNDVNKIGMVVSFHVNVVCRQLAQFLFGSIYLWKISRKLAMYTFAGIAVVGWVSAVYGKFNRQLAEQVQDSFADATAVAETSLSMSETIRAFNGVEIASDKYEAAQSNALELEEVQAWGYGTHKFISDNIQVALQILLLFACWRMGLAGQLPAAQLTTFMFYTNFVLESSNEVGDQWAKIQAAVGASTSVFGLIRRIPKVRDPPVKKQSRREPALAPADGEKQVTVDAAVPQINGAPDPNGVAKTEPIIEMANMTVTYGAMDVPALDKVNLKIYEGDRVAIVGRSGSGKSSMLRAILRFYDPSGGVIKLTGTPLKEMPRCELARRVAVVEQEPSLFPMTLLENVLYGIDKDSVDPRTGEPCYSEQMRKSCAQSLQEAGLPVVPGNDLNLELDTRVGEGGRSLSGGQRQRVAIARALIRNPEVLLLDEPTAALDSQSENMVVTALRNAMQHSNSMVMVTHRLGVVRSLDVNRVIVMDKGKIVEEGHPEDLLEHEEGLYFALAREQGIHGGRHLSPSRINKYLHE